MTDRRNRKTFRAISKAREEAEALGPITEVEPGSRLPADGSPQLGPGQVYVTRTGKNYHPTWCEVVGLKWDADPKGLLVIMEDTAGRRIRCRRCDPLI